MPTTVVFDKLFPRADHGLVEIERAIRGWRLIRITYTRTHARVTCQALTDRAVGELLARLPAPRSTLPAFST